MSKTLNNCLVRVRRVLDEATAANWQNSDLTVLVNERYHRVHTAVCTVFEDYKISTSFISTVANQQEYTLPTDLFKLRRVEINYDITNSNSVFQRAASVANIDAVATRLAETNISSNIVRNPVYYNLGTSIGFLPIPDKAGTSAIKLWYIPLLTDLVNTTDTLDLPYVDRYYNIVCTGAAADALRFGQVESLEADKLDQKFIADILLMQEELEDRIAENSKFVINTDPISFESGGY